MQYVNDITPESVTRTESKKHRGRSNVKRGVLIWSFTLLIWGGLAYGGYTLASQYIDQTQSQLSQLQTELAQIKQANEASIVTVNQNITEVHTKLQADMEQHSLLLSNLYDQLDVLDDELALIKEELLLAGATLSSTDQTKETLGARISELNEKLAQLQQSIAKLEEAARVY